MPSAKEAIRSERALFPILWNNIRRRKKEAGTVIDNEGKYYVAVYGVQTQKLYFDEKQEDGDRTAGAEEVL